MGWVMPRRAVPASELADYLFLGQHRHILFHGGTYGRSRLRVCVMHLAGLFVHSEGRNICGQGLVSE